MVLTLWWYPTLKIRERNKQKYVVVELQVLGLELGVDFAWDNNNNNNNNNNNDNNKNDKNPHLNFWKGTTLGDKEQGVGIRDKG